MYEINVSTRRVTQYIIDEAYKWLYLRIKAGEYESNRCKEGKILMVQIEEERKVTEKNYKQFIRLFENSPFSYMMYRGKRHKSKKITTDILVNYFVSYNGTVLPLGFVKDFFEDDYETQQEIKALLVDFGKGSKEDTAISWKHMLINKENAIDHLYDSYPSLLKIHPTLLITQIIRLVITAFMTAWVFIALNAIHFWSYMQVFMKTNKFDFSESVVIEEGIEVFGKSIAEKSAIDPLKYFELFGLQLFLALISVFILIALYEKLIRFAVFAVRVMIHNIQLKQMRSRISKFEQGGIESIGEYYVQIIPSIIQNGRIEDSDCQGVPAEKQLFNKISSFDHQKLADKFTKLVAKYSDLKFTYEVKKLSTVKKVWTGGIVLYIILTIALAFFMVPSLYELVLKLVG